MPEPQTTQIYLKDPCRDWPYLHALAQFNFPTTGATLDEWAAANRQCSNMNVPQISDSALERVSC